MRPKINWYRSIKPASNSSLQYLLPMVRNIIRMPIRNSLDSAIIGSDREGGDWESEVTRIKASVIAMGNTLGI
jgi:hypothetical protein